MPRLSNRERRCFWRNSTEERSARSRRAGTRRFLGALVRSLPDDMTPAIEALAKDFKVCKVNVDKNQELATHYGVSSIPALLIFKDGKIAARHVGVTPEATLRAEMTTDH